MDSEFGLLVIYVEIADNKQIDVSAECADKDRINFYDSGIILNNYTPDYTSF